MSHSLVAADTLILSDLTLQITSAILALLGCSPGVCGTQAVHPSPLGAVHTAVSVSHLVPALQQRKTLVNMLLVRTNYRERGWVL